MKAFGKSSTGNIAQWPALLLFPALLLYYYFAGPDEGLSCPIYRFSGWKCAGCGAQRALHALLHGRVREAFLENPLFVATLPFVFVWGLRYFFITGQKPPQLRSHTIFGIILLLLAYMLLRNLCPPLLFR